MKNNKNLMNNSDLVRPDFFVSGLSGSGKDTVSDYLKSYFGYYKFRLADTIKRIICERENISFEELEKLKRSNPEIRKQHTDLGDYLGKYWHLNRAKLLFNRKALDWVNLNKDNNFVICDIRSKLEAETLLNEDVYGIFLSRTTSEYKVENHWTENNLFTNGEIYDIIANYGERCIIILNGGEFDLEKIKESINEVTGEPIIKIFDNNPNGDQLVEIIDSILSELIEKEN
jgi:hypothetical protein